MPEIATRKNLTWIERCAQTLRVTEKPESPSNIGFLTGMSGNTRIDVLKRLKAAGLLEEVGVRLQTTPKGREFVKRFEALMELMK